jgi:transposase
MKGVFQHLTQAIRHVEATRRQREHGDEWVTRLETIPGVEIVVAAVDKIGRFARANQLTAYNGIVPTVRSSGENSRDRFLGRDEARRVRYGLKRPTVWCAAGRLPHDHCRNGFGKWRDAGG